MKAAIPVLLLLAGAAPTEVTFRDISAKAGISALIVSGGPKKNYVLEVNGSGVCWLDYDGDGLQDLYFVNGTTLEAIQGKSRSISQNHLYRNNGDGTFRDVTAKAGVAGRGWGFGCVAADYDNDGHPDLLVTNFGTNILYHNNGDGTFADVAEKAGVAGGNIWHTGAAFGDYDNDGFLDLYVAGYLDFNFAAPELRTCEYRGVKVHACGPLGYKGAPDALYHNNGNGTFTDVTARAGVTDKNLYFGFTVLFEDLDDDGRADIFVGNDSNPNYFYRNKGDGTFEETGVASGLAFSGDGQAMSSMGVAAGDYDGDGRTDLFVTTFANDHYVLFHNDGGGFFTDVSYPAGVGEATIPFLGWGTFFLDYDNDGRKDLFAANGHVYPEVDGAIGETYRQTLLLFRNVAGKFRDVSSNTGMRQLGPLSARGAAFADFDNDGDLDIAISRIEGSPLLLENVGGNHRHWLKLRLTGVRSNRDAVGARVKVVARGAAQYDRVRAGGNYLSGNDMRPHFGLGDAATADEVEVRWPSGIIDRLAHVKADRLLTIKEGDYQKTRDQ